MYRSPFSLKNKVVLITGASSGIGRQCAISFSSMGATCILMARRAEKLYSLAEQISGKHYVIPFDVTNFNTIETVIAEAVEKTGKIDGFVHSAGIELTKPLKITSTDDMLHVLSVNSLAAVNFAKVLAKAKYSEKISMVFIASIMGIVGNKALTAYTMSKGAIISVVKTLALEYAAKGIRVNAVSPGHLADTEMNLQANKSLSNEAINNLNSKYPLGIGSTQDIANACIYLLSDAGRWISGTNLVVDGGYTAQ